MNSTIDRSELFLRLFLFAGGVFFSFCAYGASGWNIVSLVLCALFIFFALLCFAYALFYDKMTAFDSKLEQKQEASQKKRMANKRYVQATDIALSIFGVVMILGCIWFVLDRIAAKQYIVAAVFGVLGIKYVVSGILFPSLNSLAATQGWLKVQKLTKTKAIIEEEQKLERRKNLLEHPVDRDTIAIIRQVENKKALEKDIELAVDLDCDKGMLVLWPIGGDDYAVQFPGGITRINLVNFIYDFEQEVVVWCKSSHTKRLSGQWAMISLKDDDGICAVSDDGRQWEILDDDEELLFRSTNTHHLDFSPRPELQYDINNPETQVFYNE